MLGADLSPFFRRGEFASEAQLAGVAVLGIFDNPHVPVELGMGVASTNPTFLLATVEVPLDPIDRELVHQGMAYRIAAHEPDGTGASILILERMA